MDRWPIFQTQTFEEFPFPVDRYEEYVENAPVIGNFFTINQKVVKLAFSFINLDRLIDFY